MTRHYPYGSVIHALAESLRAMIEAVGDINLGRAALPDAIYALQRYAVADAADLERAISIENGATDEPIRAGGTD